MGRKKIYVEFDGKSRTMTEWAEKLGVTAQALYERQRRGLPPERVFTSNKNPGRRPTVYKHNGVEKTIKQWAKETGVSVHNIHRRLNSGLPSDQVLKNVDLRKKEFGGPARPPGPTQKTRKLTLNGKEQTILEWSKELNISKNTIYSRIHKGLPVEKVLFKRKKVPA